MFDNNFGICGPIFKVLSPTDSFCTQGLPPHLQYVATLPRESRKSKKIFNVIDFDSILNKLLTCS